MPVNWFWGTPAHWFQVDVVHWLIKSSHSHICIPVLCQYTRKHNHATSKKNMITPTDWKLWEMWWQLLTMVIPHNITLLCILQVLEYLLCAAMMCIIHTLHYSVVHPAGVGVPAVGSHDVHGPHTALLCCVSCRYWSTCCGQPCAWRPPCLWWQWSTCRGEQRCTRLCASVTTTAKLDTMQRYGMKRVRLFSLCFIWE